MTRSENGKSVSLATRMNSLSLLCPSSPPMDNTPETTESTK